MFHVGNQQDDHRGGVDMEQIAADCGDFVEVGRMLCVGSDWVMQLITALDVPEQTADCILCL